ncbi:MAG TPA: helix-turn-helix transcriptional regulator [Streptosporangiaceae bacterium]|nr:helix-turn-helix transcriptional regulator [Streptosporangiaceae bacterium]
METQEATVRAPEQVVPAPDEHPLLRGNCRIEFAPRQCEILALVADGLADKEIAVKLGVSARTVRTHLERLYHRYDLHSRSAAVALWLRSGSPGTDGHREAAGAT